MQLRKYQNVYIFLILLFIITNLFFFDSEIWELKSIVWTKYYNKIWWHSKAAKKALEIDRILFSILFSKR